MNVSIRTFVSAVVIVLPFSSGLAQPFRGAELMANGLGELKIGMTFDDVNRDLKQKINPSNIEFRATPNCDYNKLADIPGVALVFIDNVLSRIDVERSGIKASHGIAVGDRQSDVVKKLHNAKKEPLDHVPEGVAYVIEHVGSQNGLSFQFENGVLVRMIAGNRKVIRYAEACM